MHSGQPLSTVMINKSYNELLPTKCKFPSNSFFCWCGLMNGKMNTSVFLYLKEWCLTNMILVSFLAPKEVVGKIIPTVYMKNFYNYFLTRLQKSSLSSCQSESFWSLCFECQVYYELAKFTENFANIKPTSKTSKSLVKLFTMTSRARIPKTVHFSQKSCKAGGSDTTYL